MLRKVGRWFTGHLYGHQVTLVEPIRPGELQDEETDTAQGFDVRRHCSVSVEPVGGVYFENGNKKHRRLSERLVIQRKTKVQRFSASEDELHRMKGKVHSLGFKDAPNGATEKQSEPMKNDGQLSGPFKEKLPEGKRRTGFNKMVLPPLREAIRDIGRGVMHTEVLRPRLLSGNKRRFNIGQSSLLSFSPKAETKDKNAEESNINEKREKQGVQNDMLRADPSPGTKTSYAIGKTSSTENVSKPEGSKAASPPDSTGHLSSKTKRKSPPLFKETSSGEEEVGNNMQQDSSTPVTKETNTWNEKGQNGCASESVADTSISRPSYDTTVPDFKCPRGTTCQATPSEKWREASPASIEPFAFGQTASSPGSPTTFRRKMRIASNGEDRSKLQESFTVLYSEEELELMGAIVQQFS